MALTKPEDLPKTDKTPKETDKVPDLGDKIMSSRGPAFKPKQCPECNQLFTPDAGNQVYCSACAVIAKKRAKSEWYKKNKEKLDLARKRKSAAKRVKKKAAVSASWSNNKTESCTVGISNEAPRKELIPPGDLNDCIDFLLCCHLTDLDSISFVRNNKRITIENID